MVKPAVMIVRQQDTLGARVLDVVAGAGLSYTDAHRTDDAGETWRRERPRVVVIVESGRNAGGSNLIRAIRALDTTTPIIMVVRYSSETRAITALRLGVNDYFGWPLPDAELLESIRRHLARAETLLPGESHRNASTHDGVVMVGESPSIKQVARYVDKVAAVNSTILITGETGTGKECVARVIHKLSARSRHPLVCVNCAALPDTLLESELFGYERGAFTGATAAYAGKLKLAQGGSIFLDEIGDMTPFAQAKVLRVLEDRQVTPLGGETSTPCDLRFIAATNQSLERLIEERRFRKDLFYRLKVALIHLPPLRQRKDDIPLLVAHYLDEFAHQFGTRIAGVTNEAYRCLLAWDWPGNVRELKNLIESLYIDRGSGWIEPEDLPEEIRRCAGPRASESERELLLSALAATNWNKSRVAKRLNWSRMTVYRKMAKYNIAQQPEPDDAPARGASVSQSAWPL